MKIRLHSFHYTLTLAGRFSSKICDIVTGTVRAKSSSQAEIDAISDGLRGMSKEARGKIRVSNLMVYRMEG